MISFLKRRFSSGDIQGELKDERETQVLEHTSNVPINNLPVNKENTPNVTDTLSVEEKNALNNFAREARPMNMPKKQPSPSAPTSPTKTISLSAMMSAAKEILNNNSNNWANQPVPQQQASSQAPQSRAAPYKPNTNHKEKFKVLLIIDYKSVDWIRFFRNKKINEFELRVEQAEFKDINMASYADTGAMIDITIERNGTKLVRPDFVLIRQHVRDLDCDWRNIIIGLQYGCVPSVNSLTSIYNFGDKPWIFANLIQINKRFGDELFPLINQTYYPNHKEMLSVSRFPCVVKVGHAHQGLGKIKIENALDFQDVTAVASMSNSYCTTEQLIESKCDLHIQKIGDSYKAYKRKSITGNWKTNIGSALLEQIPLSDKYKFWVDEVSKMFGGLDICAVQAVINNETGKEFIIDVCDCSFTLLGESQDFDRKLVADLVYDKMCKISQLHEEFFTRSKPKTDPSSQNNKAAVENNSVTQQPTSPMHKNSVSQSEAQKSPTPALVNSCMSSSMHMPNTGNANTHSAMPTSRSTLGTTNNTQTNNVQTNNVQANLKKPLSSSFDKQEGLREPTSKQSLPVNNSVVVNNSNAPINPSRSKEKINERRLPARPPASDEQEDTMNNLRKTFAGIFGDMM